ncbi:hypothetical protein [Lentzea sp.]|uniref:hypothetical protein n=1 Tax=Lentzea sp. TaxID=56099 RepID=UPI002BBC603F|nr:hypothetical protein [Lentzea sp.]HUQ57230.1 hypothetical protein [Lentzea sp.]
MQKRIGAAVLAAAAVAMTFTGSAQAETNPSCSSGVTRMGATKYLEHGGETVVSLKQFKGCNKNWAYVCIWDSWKADHPSNHIRAGIWTRTSDGAVDYAGHDGTKQELWSNGANTLSVCTYAAGSVYGSGYSASGSTEERC